VTEGAMRLEGRVLVAGIGNIFLGDDGFGVEVARRLTTMPLRDGVRVVDFGVRGLHLAYEMSSGAYDSVILVDAAPRGEARGTVYLIAPGESRRPAGGPGLSRAGAAVPDAHAMSPETVLSLVESLGTAHPPVFVVGCEPAAADEGIGLSEPAAGAVDGAVALIRDLVEGEPHVPGDPGPDYRHRSG
jgi:hydrogenase maturation protease